MSAAITGLHHVTCITSKPQEHVDFYTKVLGLRMVKLTVNYDDPTTYHTYFGDEVGSPGTLMTFFPWVKMRQGRLGTGQISAVAFSIPQGSSKFWMQRLKTLEVPVDSYTSERFGETVVTLRDPDFLTIELVESANDPRPNGAERFGVPSEYALKGFHSVTALEQTIDSTESVLTKTMELAALDTESNRKRFAAGDQKSGMLIDIVLRPEMQRGTQGAGSVHHVAFRTPNDSTHAEMLEIVTKAGYQTSGIIDRDYFHSIYFREPGGVLFEIATDPPGMTVNEPLEKLGHDLLLPDRYEPHRKEIEMSLPRLVLPESGKVVGAL